MNDKRTKHYNTLRDVARKGADKIPCFKRGKYWFFIPEKTDEWIEAGKQ